MAKVAHLTVHRNTRLQRQRKEVRNHLALAIRGARNEPDLTGYALVTWTSSDGQNTGDTIATWCQRGPIIPTGLLGDFVRRVIHRQENTMDIDSRIETRLFGPEDDGA